MEFQTNEVQGITHHSEEVQGGTHCPENEAR